MSQLSYDPFDPCLGASPLKMLMDLKGEHMAVGGPMIRHLKEGSYQRNIWQEHVAHLVNDEFLSLIDKARQEIKPADYLTMTAHLAEVLDRERETAASSCDAIWIFRFPPQRPGAEFSRSLFTHIMRLLTICVSTERYGSENHMLRVACAAARRGIEVHAAFPRTDGTASMIRDCEAAGVSYWPFDWEPLSKGRVLPRILPIGEGRSLPKFLQMRKLLNAVRPDVVQLTAGWPSEIWVPSLSCALYHVPMLAVFQLAPALVFFPERQLKALAWARRRRQRWMAVSRHNLSFLQATFRTGADEIGILANGIEIADAPGKAETEAQRRDVRSELELPANAKILMTTARIDSNKGHADLLEIVPLVIDRLPDAVFVWAGDGGDRTVLEAQVRQRGLQRHFRFLGYRTDVERLLRASDLFLFPSHHEGGCSSSIREAMVNCLPIVCSDAGGIPEVVSDGVHGLVFPAKNIDRMFARLCDALSRPAEMRALAAQARKRIEEFSAERMVESYLAVFRQLCQLDQSFTAPTPSTLRQDDPNRPVERA